MKPSASRRKTSTSPIPDSSLDFGGGAYPAERRERIAVAAYYRAEARGFSPGEDMDDWLRAEAEVDRAAAG